VSNISLSGIDAPLAFLHSHVPSNENGILYLIGVSTCSSPLEVYVWKLFFSSSVLVSNCLFSKCTLPSDDAILHLEPICRDYQLDKDDSASSPLFLTVDDKSIVRYWSMIGEIDLKWKCDLQFPISRNTDWIVSRVKTDRNGKMAVGVLLINY
jgi:hypothetical protein